MRSDCHHDKVSIQVNCEIPVGPNSDLSFAADSVWRMQVLIFCTLCAAYCRRYFAQKVFPSHNRAIPGAFRASGATGTT